MAAVPSPTIGGLAFFADRFGVDARRCDELLRVALERGGDYADLFFEYTRQRFIKFDEGTIQSSSGIVQGLGVRVVRREAVGYAYTEAFDLASMREAARTAANIAIGVNAPHRPVPVQAIATADRYAVAIPPVDAPAEEKITLLRRVDGAARSVAPSIKNVEVRFTAQVRQLAVATSEGRLAGDTQPMATLIVIAVSARGADRQLGFQTVGARAGMDFGAAVDRAPEAIGREAAELAVLLHDAVDAPAGRLPVVLAAGDSGILLHEAVGHGLEADFNRKRLSNFTGRVGQPVASPLCTVVDDGTQPTLYGSVNIDDEAQEPAYNVLIEKGVLRGYLHDWQSAHHYGVPPSGNGRRQDFRHPPMPRMTTTYLLPGEATPEEIIRSVDRGIYCRRFGDGQVNTGNGDYVFSTTEAYLIEGGRVTAPLRRTNLIGNGPDSLGRVTMVGNDLQLSTGTWNCGKDVQSVPVSFGLPTVLVDGITVGGTQR